MPIAVFDVLGTLFAFDEAILTISETFPNLSTPAKTVFYLWMWSSLRDFFAASHAGPYVPFINILRAGLPRTLRFVELEFSQEQLDTVLASLKRLKPEVGAAEAIKQLVDNGWEVWGLTNGGKELARNLLEKGGLLEYFTCEPSSKDDTWDGLKIVSCDDVKISKPHPKVYSDFARLAVRQSGKIQNMYMIATHAWDLGGAKNCGMRTVYLTLEEHIYLEGDIFSHPPDITGDSMVECIDQMIAFERRRSVVSWDGRVHGRALPAHLLEKMD